MHEEEKDYKRRRTTLPFFGLAALAPFLKPFAGYLLAIVGLITLGSVCDAIIPLFQNYAIQHFIGENTLDTLALFVILYFAMLLLQCVVNSVGCYISAKLEVLVDRDLRQACFDHVQTLSFSYFNQNSVGYMHARMISDPNKIGQIVSWGLMDFVTDIVYIISIFVVMFSLEPRLGLLLVLVVPIEAAATWIFQGYMASQHWKVRELNSIITGNFNEGITGAKNIKTLVVEKKIQKDFEADTEKMRGASVVAWRYRAMFDGTIVFFSSIALALILWRGGLLTRQGLIFIGALSVFMNYATSIGNYVQNLVGTISNLTITSINIERIMKLLHTQADVTDTPEVIDRYGDSFVPKKENWEELHGDIRFDDVTFMYPDGEENVLEHFDLDVPQGSMVAIVGETGAGKSTLVNLVCRFFEPTGGRVLIDGRDARERSQLWLHSHIGYVLQTPHLFSGTVLENLRYGNPDATMEQIREACRRVRADKVIERMENGYDSQVGEGGSMLSTGEKQLISFARALLADPRILILDEATSSVDTLTEKAIQNAIGEVTSGRTSFVIAHRLSTIRDADVILAMMDGKIVERGTHDELMAAKGYYYRLYTRQFMQDAEDEAFAHGKDERNG